MSIHEIKGNISSGSILCKCCSINSVSGWESAVNIQWNHQRTWNPQHIWKIRVHSVYKLVSSMYHKCQVVIFSVTLRCYMQNNKIKQMPRHKGLLSTWLSSVLRCGLSPCSTGTLRNLCSNSCSALHLCCSSFKRHLVNYKKEKSLLSKHVITRTKITDCSVWFTSTMTSTTKIPFGHFTGNPHKLPKDTFKKSNLTLK